MKVAVQFAVGLVLCAILARVFLVMGLIVPVTVAGRSMAPTFHGPHVAAVCPNCGEVTRADVDPQLPTQIVCSVCSRPIETEDQPTRAGDSIWIDRTAYVMRPPRRWEVVVFQCPNDATQLCVKRVLGLPGERIAFRDGELFVDDERVPKPFAIDYEIRHGDGIGQAEFDSRQQCWQLGMGYFVVGDNQSVSYDSRNWPAGPDLPVRLIVGRPIGRSDPPTD